MNDTFKKLAGVLGSVAPTLASMLGGPLAGVAVTALESAFGMAPGSGADSITQVVQSGAMTPEVIAQVRARDQEHAEKLKQLDIDVQKLNADRETSLAQTDANDRASARAREVAVRGATTPALAWLVVTASVALGAAIVLGFVTKDPQLATLVGTVIGYVFSEAKQVLAYYFGSSASSDRKTELLASPTPKE
jgi:predicted phage gp36 major capsid-like protein